MPPVLPIRHFTTGYPVQDPNDINCWRPTTPGLIIDANNDVYRVGADGTFTALSASGGSLPAEWTVGLGGGLTITPDNSDLGLKIVQTDNASGALTVDAHTATNFANLLFLQIPQAGGGLTYDTGGGFYLLNRPDGNIIFTVDGTRSLILAPLMPTADPHVVDALWNDAGTVKVSSG